MDYDTTTDTAYDYDEAGRCIVPLCERCGWKHDHDLCTADDQDYWKPEAD